MRLRAKSITALFALLTVLASCNFLMYDNREIPPRQIPAMEHVYTKEIPQNNASYTLNGAVLSGQPDSFEVLLLAEYENNPPQFLYLKPESPAIFIDNALSNPRSLMRCSSGFAAVTVINSTNKSLDTTYFMNNQILNSTPIFSFGTSSLPALPSIQFPVYDPQQSIPFITSYDPDNLYLVPWINLMWQPQTMFTNIVSRLREAFSLLNDTNYPAASFWNINSYNMQQAECLYNSTMLLRVSKYSESGKLSEKYLFLVNTQSSALVGPKRVFVDLPSVLFKDADGNVMVLQAVKKNERSTTFQFLDASLNIRKKLVVYGDSVYPLGYQTRAGIPGLAFLVRSSRWGSSLYYLSVFFLPLSKIGEL